LRLQYIKGIYYWSPTFGGQIDTITYPVIEKIGYSNLCVANNDYFYFNPICAAEDQFILDWLRCYNDSNISYTGCYWSTHFPGLACDALINGSGIDSYSEINSIKIFPNPVEDIGYISWNVSSTNRIATLLITDIAGRIYKSVDVSLKESYEIRKDDFPSGLYIVKLYDNLGQCSVKKILIW
jgi:hypothetical protein